MVALPYTFFEEEGGCFAVAQDWLRQYPTVRNGENCTLGGSQLVAGSALERKVGCGPVAALDLLILLHRRDKSRCRLFREKLPAENPIPLAVYNELLGTLRRRYFPLIPRFGINGLSLCFGLNAFFIKNRLPYRASWGVSYGKLLRRVREMLGEGLPVICGIGPRFPRFLGRDGLPLYVRHDDGSFRRATQTSAHYVTITDFDDEWLHIVSWGRRYYVRREDFFSYGRRRSLPLVNNILLIKKTRSFFRR